MSLAIVLLAGELREGALRRQLGFPTAGLPLEADLTLLHAWLRLIAQTPGLSEAEVLIACNSERDRAWFSAESQRFAPGLRVPRAVLDPRPHRGVAGVLADLAAELGGVDALLVAELNSVPPRDLRELMNADPESSLGSEVKVGVGVDDRWFGVYRIGGALLKHVSRDGYVDLKEQFIPALCSGGYRIEAVEFGDTPVQISSRRNYIRAVRIWQARSEIPTSQDSRVSGFSVVCPGVEIQDLAHVADSVVLPGAVIGEAAVVARSIIGPMIHVPSGAVIVDSMLVESDLSTRSPGTRTLTRPDRAAAPLSVGSPRRHYGWRVRS